MYSKFFGFSEQPFNMTPDPRFFFPSGTHQEVCQTLMYGITNKKGFLVLTGEVGTGKTTMCRTMLQLLGPEVETALVLNPELSALEILQAVNRDFGLPAGSVSKSDLMDTLYAFLAEQSSAGRNVVIIIDDAQNMSPAALEQVRLISNFETDREKLVQILLVGQPELDDTLDGPELRQLKQRITVRTHLNRLSAKEVVDYVNHRLAVAGADPEKIRFTEDALKRIVRETAGYPRSVNVLCDRALVTAYQLRLREISEHLVWRESRILRLRPSLGARLRNWGMAHGWTAAGSLAAGLLVGCLFVWWAATPPEMPGSRSLPPAGIAAERPVGEVPSVENGVQGPEAPAAGSMLDDSRREAESLRVQLRKKEEELRILQADRERLRQEGGSQDSAAAQDELTSLQLRENELKARLEALRIELQTRAADIERREKALESLNQKLSQVVQEKEHLARNLQAREQLLASIQAGQGHADRSAVEKLRQENQNLQESQQLMQNVAAKTIEVQAKEIERLSREKAMMTDALKRAGIKEAALQGEGATTIP